MPKIRTSELTGAALDWAVAKCERAGVTGIDHKGNLRVVGNSIYSPSTDGGIAVLIIEREEIDLNFYRPLRYWVATIDLNEGDVMVVREQSISILIAAMRCYVASKLGETVDIPRELIKD